MKSSEGAESGGDPSGVQGLVIRAESLSVSRGDHRVLDGIDFQVAVGQVVAVQGSSGAGKSTLLATLCGLIRPASGSLWVAGARLDHRPDRVRSAVRLRKFGLVFQGDELLPELTLGENITLPLRLIGRPRRTADYLEGVRQVLSKLGIEELVDRMPSDVSGGQLQRAAVARAVVHGPDIVLADEPTTSLDETSARSAMELLIDLARERNTAVVVVTHDDEVARRCDRRLLLVDGRLAAVESSAAG